MKIFHAADIHLGRRRLDGRLPESDMADAFRFIAEDAVREKADVFLIAGDLFDRPQVEPPHLRQAQEVLRILKNAGIPVIAIEGNHDRQFVNSDIPTWVRFLAEDELLILLRPEFGPDGANLEAWNSSSYRGSYIDIGGIRFIGAGYLGAATPSKTRQIIEAADAALPKILLLHAGPDYFVGEGGGFSQADLDHLRQNFCYLALGHIHKPMLHENWACNPGSPENCDLREAAYDRGKNSSIIPRGYAVVTIDPSDPHGSRTIEIRSNPRRPYYRVTLDCEPFGAKTKDGIEAFRASALTVIEATKPAPSAVVELVLEGVLNLNRIALDPLNSAVELATVAKVFAISIDTFSLNVANDRFHLASGGDEPVSREQLERSAIRQIVASDPPAGLDGQVDDLSGLLYELKEAVRSGERADTLANRIATSPLIEIMRLSKDRGPFPDVPQTAPITGL